MQWLYLCERGLFSCVEGHCLTEHGRSPMTTLPAADYSIISYHGQQQQQQQCCVVSASYTLDDHQHVTDVWLCWCVTWDSVSIYKHTQPARQLTDWLTQLTTAHMSWGVVDGHTHVAVMAWVRLIDTCVWVSVCVCQQWVIDWLSAAAKNKQSSHWLTTFTRWQQRFTPHGSHSFTHKTNPGLSRTKQDPMNQGWKKPRFFRKKVFRF